MFNWNTSLRGQGFPMQNAAVPIVGFSGPSQMPMNAAAMAFQQPQWGHQQQPLPPGLGVMPMMGQQHPQWQQQQHMQPQHFQQQQQAGMFPPHGMRMGMMGGINPLPPSFPPPEERPPLPSEPPPPLPSTPHDKPPLPSEEPKPPLPKEESRAPFQDGPRPPDGPAPPKPAPPARPPSPDPALVAELEKVKKEELVFLEQYKQWKKQYDDWREQNQNHPNKEQYEQYLSQWKTYEGQMEARKQSIAEQKADLEEQVGGGGQQADSRLSSERDLYEAKHVPHIADRGVSEGRDSLSTAQERQKEEESQLRPQVEGDDMDLDDEEESGAGGIIESSTQAWPSRPQDSREPPQQPVKPWEDRAGGAPSGDRKSWHSQDGGLDEPLSEESRFRSWEPPEQGASGPGGFFGGRGSNWGVNSRGAMGQEPRLGWRGGDGPRFKGPFASGTRADYPERGTSEWENHEKTQGYQEDDVGDDRAAEGSYTDDRYGEEDDEAQRYSGDQGLKGFNSFTSGRDRAGPDVFPRGRGGEFLRGRGGGFERGRGGVYGRGEPLGARRGDFSTGQGHSYRGRGGRFLEDSTKSDYFNPSVEHASDRGRGSWPMRGRGVPQRQFPNQYNDNLQDSYAGYDQQGKGDFDDVERQAQEQYEEEEEVQHHESKEDVQFGMRGRGRGGMLRGRGRGTFQSSFEQEQEDNSREDSQDYYYEDHRVGFGDRGRGMFRGRAGVAAGRGEGFRGRGRGIMDIDGREMSFGSGNRGRGEMSYVNREMGETDYSNRGRGEMNYANQGRGEVNYAGRGRGEMYHGNRGRGEVNYANRGIGRGFERGRGALRGRGGHSAQFQETEEDTAAAGYYDDGYDFGNEEAPAQSEAYHPRGRGRGVAGRPGFGRGTYAAADAEDQDKYDDAGESSQWDPDQFHPQSGQNWGGARGRGRGMAPPSRQDFRDRWTEGAYGNDAEGHPQRSEYESKMAENNNITNQDSAREDEPLLKRGRFDTDERDPYVAPTGRFPPPLSRDRFDPYGDPYRDPYSRYPDPYLRDPYFDPYGPPSYDRGYDMYGKYDRSLPEKKPFAPAESIDYGHGELDKEKKKAAIQPKEVIDYGHGRSSEPQEDARTTPANARAGEDRLLSARYEEIRARSRERGWRGGDKDNLDRDERSSSRPKDFAIDDPYRLAADRYREKYDQSSRTGPESSSRGEFSDLYGNQQSYGLFPSAKTDSSLGDVNRHGNLSADSDRALERSQGDRRAKPDVPDLFDRDSKGSYSRDHDARYKRDPDETSDRNRGAGYGSDRSDPYRRDREDSFGRDKDDHFRERDTYGRSSELYDRDSDDPFNRGRDDRKRERDGLYSRDRDRRESPRGRRSDMDDRYGDSTSRDELYRRDDGSFQGRDYVRRDGYGSSRRRDDEEGDPLSRERRGRGDRGDSQEDGLRNVGSLNSMSRWGDSDSYSRDQRYSGLPGAGDLYGERSVSSPARNSPVVRPAPAPLPVAEVKKVEDLLCSPGRQSRPPQLVIIIRGLPGSGKTYVSKLLREKEIKHGGSAPRMLCLDDYFMVEVDKQEVDPDTGKKVKRKVLEYEYEQAVEEAYRQSLLKSFKKTVDDGFFPFIIVDATNEKIVHFSEFWSYAKSRGFQVYVGELNVDITTCIQRNIHHWTEWDIQKVKSNWEPLPNHYIRLDLRWLLQDDSIAEVEMEDTDPNEAQEEEKEPNEEAEGEEEDDDDEGESGFDAIYKKSKWELDSSEKTLDKLDGIPVSKKHIAEHQSLKDYLQLDQPDQLDDDYFARESLPGQKRVRWADLEEKKTQNRRRDLGFIVGQTQRDWERITDDDFATKALNQTKYFYKN